MHSWRDALHCMDERMAVLLNPKDKTKKHGPGKSITKLDNPPKKYPEEK